MNSGHRWTRLLREMHSFSAKHPDSIAVCDRSGQRKTTQSEFWCAIGKMSNCLRSRGLGVGDVIVINLGNTFEHIAARYAIACIGGVSVSLSDSNPEERKREIIDISESKFVIDEKFCEEIKGFDSDVIIGDFPDDLPGIIIFTSGSTGKPKGAIHSRGLFLHLMDVAAHAGIDFSDKRHACLSDFTFIASISEIASILGCRGSVYLVDEGMKKDPVLLSRFLAENGIYSMIVNPSMYRAVGKSLGLKCYFLAGETARNIPVLPGVKVINIYGSTEVIMSITPIEESSEESCVSGSFKGSRLFILGEDGKPSERGEICYSGNGIMLGYIGETENPFTYSPDGEKIYHTNDLGIMTDKGIVVIGRLDGMVKINGNRVETAEVEKAIESVEGVSESAVKPFKDGNTNYLCGYYLSEKKVGENEVRKALSEKLPYYMIPQFIKRFEKFKRTANGKISRDDLPDLKVAKAAYMPPENDVQKKICNAFSKVLEIKKVGIDDDFVLFGGNSIKAMAVQSELDFAIGTSDILLWRTPRMISENVSISETEEKHGLSFNNQCPLNDSQMDTYLDDRARLGVSTKYNNPFRLVFKKKIPFEKIESLISKLTQAHPIMKMRVDESGNEPTAVFDCVPKLVRGNPDSFLRPFNLSSGPLCRFMYSEEKGKTVMYADFHHLISDGTSMAVLVKDVESLLSGKKIKFDDGILHSVARDRKAEKSNGWKKAEEYFCRLLDGRGTLNGFLSSPGKNKPGIRERTLSVGKTELESFFTANGITAGTFFEAAFAYALSRFTGDTDALYCNIVSGRDGIRIPNAVGMFVRTVPTITDCSDRTVPELVRNVAESEYEKSSLGPYPSRELAKRFGVSTAITFQYSYDMALGSRLFSVEPIYNVPAGDFGMNVSISGDSFKISISHSEKYSDETVSLFADVYEKIVFGFLSKKTLSEIEIATDSCIEKMDLINRTDRKLRYGGVLAVLRENVRKNPNATCLSYQDRNYSFSAVDKKSNAVANALLEAGIENGDRVAFVVPRSEWYFICIMGILKSGAAYVPIDDSYPEERKSFMISDSGSKAVLIIPETSSDNLKLAGVPYIDVTKCGNQSPVSVKTGQNDPFCVLYTSGTTGTPKGSLIRHVSAENYAEWFSEAVGAKRGDSFAFYGSIGFDAHIEVFFSALVAGSKIDIIPASKRMDLNLLADYVVDRKITHVDLPTAVARMFIDVYPDIKIKCLIAGGEKFGELHAKTCYRIIDTYGPTETTVSVLATDVKSRSSPSSVGKPISNSKIYILDAERRRVPFGAVGELCVSGIPLSLGYLNDDALNGKAYFEIQLKSGKKEKVYSTGDFFRYLPDGSLEIIGRHDGQMKIMGNRIESAEIESAIRKVPHIKDVTVQPFTTKNGDTGLCAYVVTDSGTSEDSVSLSVRSFVSERKPSYMVPSQVVVLKSIPLTINGKVDRNSLPAPNDIMARPKYLPPKTVIEKEIAAVFSEVLGVEKIGLDDDFLLLGGDSLKSIRAASSFNSKNGDKRVSAIDVLRYRTPRAISKHVSVASVKKADYDISKKCPLTDSQIAFYEYAREKGVETNIAAIISFEDMDPEGLRSAIVKTVDSHVMLKSHIVSENGRLWNAFDRMPEIKLCKDDPNILSEKFFRHFDLKKDVLSRFAISEFGGKCYLLADFSHLIFDGRSTLPFVESALNAYFGADLDLDDGILRQLAFEESVAASESTEKGMESVLKKFENCDLSDPFSDMGKQDDSNGTYYLETDIPVSDVEAAAVKFDSSAGVFLSAVFGYTLSRFTSRKDVVFHFSHDGRDAIDLENSVGMYVRYVPLRMKSDNSSCSDFVKKNTKYIYDSMSQYVPLWKLCEHADLRPHVIFQYQHFIKKLSMEEHGVQHRPVNKFAMKRISFDIVPDEKGIAVSILHPKNCLGKEMERLAEDFVANLKTVLGKKR